MVGEARSESVDSRPEGGAERKPRVGLESSPALNDDSVHALNGVERKVSRWPLYLILIGLALSVVWMSLLGYGAVKFLVWLAN